RPGQWYLDRTEGKVVYWPLDEEDPEKLEVVAPTTFSVIRLVGRENQPVRNVTIKGVVVSATSTPLVAGGFGARYYDGAIDAENVEDLVVTGVVVRNVGGTGIKVAAGVRTSIDHCRVHDTGAGGIYLEKSPESTITNNTVHHIGRTYHSGIGLRASCPHGTVAHNHVHHTPYSAVNAGAEGLHIEHNHLHHCMLELSDGGAIYFGFNKGVVIRGNYIHDIKDHPGRQRGRCHGIYLDERAEQCLVEKNLVVDVPCAMHGHMGTGNTWRNNACISRTDLWLAFARCTDQVLDRNVFLTWGDIVVRPPEAIGSMPDNIFYSADGKLKAITLDDYEAVGEDELTLTDGSVAEDPQLNLQGKCVDFPDGSSARRLGIEPIDVSTAGPLD
ncbi:MAG: right-handed parallel beta-helix repeat-containing protein, partial [Planctomycetota bacterium]